MSQAVAVNDYDRFSFAFFMAAVLHLLIIFGIGFSLPEKQNSATTLDVTIAQSHQSKAPEEADFLAQSNQEGSGTLDELAEMTTTEVADYAAEEIQVTQQAEQTARAPKPNKQDYRAVSATDSNYDIRSHELENQLRALELPEGPTQSLLERSLAIASLEAKSDRQRQTLSKAPRVRRLTANSTRQSSDALYMNQWMQQIERAGRQNMPKEVEQDKITARLRLLVSIRADGTIHELKVLESSGYIFIDDAAKRIVRQSAPFSPFPEEMRQEVDLLEIIRTWKFTPSNFSTSN